MKYKNEIILGIKNKQVVTNEHIDRVNLTKKEDKNAKK